MPTPDKGWYWDVRFVNKVRQMTIYGVIGSEGSDGFLRKTKKVHMALVRTVV